MSGTWEPQHHTAPRRIIATQVHRLTSARGNGDGNCPGRAATGPRPPPPNAQRKRARFPSRCGARAHTCRLHPLERITTTCNLRHTLHFRGVNNTSGFPGFAARASVYLQIPLGGLPAWRIRNPQLQPSSSNRSQIFCNCSQAPPIAAGYSCNAVGRMAVQHFSFSPHLQNLTWASALHGAFANLQLQPSERTHLKVALLTKRHSRGL